MSKKIEIDDPLFILRGDDDELYLIDDPEIIAELDATVEAAQGVSDDEITRQLLAIANPLKYGNRI